MERNLSKKNNPTYEASSTLSKGDLQNKRKRDETISGKTISGKTISGKPVNDTTLFKDTIAERIRRDKELSFQNKDFLDELSDAEPEDTSELKDQRPPTYYAFVDDDSDC
jgi:hypothetical protein